MSLTAAQAVIKLDIDSNNVPPLDTMIKLCDRAGVRPVWYAQRRSPGGKGWHVTMEVSPRPRTAMEVAALQLLLGSDPWREGCNVQRARGLHRAPKWMRDRWNVLYLSDKARSRRLHIGAGMRVRC